MATDTPVLVCACCEHVPYPTRGSVASTCDRCSRAIWLDPSCLRQATTLSHAPVRVMCMDCALAHAEAEGDLAELARLLIRRGIN